MEKDPDFTWPERFPFDLFDEAGATTESSMSDIQNANFYFLKNKRMREAKPAFNQLRQVKQRMLLEFFLYRAGDIGTQEGTEHGR